MPQQEDCPGDAQSIDDLVENVAAVRDWPWPPAGYCKQFQLLVV
jgi:hypothetical protein